MSTWVFLFSIIFFYTQLVEGEYGNKSGFNNTDDSSTSYDALYDDKSDDSTTTADDGVIIEKAILAAEITPKASFNLIDPPRRRAQHIRRQSKKNNLDDHTKAPSAYTRNFATRNRSRYTQATTPTTNEIQHQNDVQSPNFTIKVFDTENKQSLKLSQSNDKHNFDITPASTTYPKKETYQTSYYKEKPIGDTSYENQNFYQPLWKPYPYTIQSFVSPSEANKILERERLSQIEATQLYLKQIETAQEYAAKALAMQKALQGFALTPTLSWNHPSENNGFRNYVPVITVDKENENQQKTVPKIGLKDLSNVGSNDDDEGYLTRFSHNAPSHSTLPYSTEGDSSWSGRSSYLGPAASPIVLPSGFLADTDAVIRARLAHLKALLEVIEARSQHQAQWQADPQQWRKI